MPRTSTSATYRRLVEALPDAVVDAADTPLTAMKARREHARDLRVAAAREAKARDVGWRCARGRDPIFTGQLRDFT